MKIMSQYRILLPAVLSAFLLAPQASATSETEDEYRAVLQADIDVSHGRVLFETCARCHGTSGAGQKDGSVPAIAGQHFRVIARQLIDYRHDERWDVYMEHFADFPSLIFAQDVAAVAGYITGLERVGPRARTSGCWRTSIATISMAWQTICPGCRRNHPSLPGAFDMVETVRDEITHLAASIRETTSWVHD